MKALFNAKCDHCGTFRPRCALVHLLMRGVVNGTQTTLCDDCRKLPMFRGRIAADSRHRGWLQQKEKRR